MDSQNAAQTEGKKKLDIGRECFEWSYAMIQAIIAVLLIFAFLAGVYSVKGRSMMDTLEDGQMLLISRLFYTPEHGDIVMFTKYGLEIADTGTPGHYAPLVKRVIGIPGDRIEFDAAGEEVKVYRVRDGERELLDEPYIRERMTQKQIDQLTVDVPEGYIYVMGDNRNHSHDSRRDDVGLVDQRFLLGRVLWRIAPLNRFGPIA